MLSTALPVLCGETSKKGVLSKETKFFPFQVDTPLTITACFIWYLLLVILVTAGIFIPILIKSQIKYVIIFQKFMLFLAHLSQRLRRSLYYRQAPLSVCPSTISNYFSETTGPIVTKFHIQPPGPLGKKSCSNGLGHMTNMAIYGKNL